MSESSQHPADLKPRGVKPALGLIPWSVVPDNLTPAALLEAARDAGRFPDGGRYAGPDQVNGEWQDDPSPWDFPSFLLSQILDGELGPCTIEDVAAAFAYGASRYAPWNWQAFAWDRAAETEYFGAICRHLRAAERGEERAEDSGVLHLAHAAAGCMIWIWHLRRTAEGDATLVEEVSASIRPAPEPVKIGDRVRIAAAGEGDEDEGFVGLIGVLEEIDPGDPRLPYGVRLDRRHGIRSFVWCLNVEQVPS